MILDDTSPSKLQPNNALNTSRISDLPGNVPLPDYETSEAQHNRRYPPLSKRIADARFWRATCVALAIYVALTIVFGIPFYLVVSILTISIASIFVNVDRAVEAEQTPFALVTPAVDFTLERRSG